MIVILCKSYKTACEAFNLFLQFLDDNEPCTVRKIFESGNALETYDDLRYIFVDYRMWECFKKQSGVEFIDVGEFFEGINEFYYYADEIDYSDL